MLTPQEIHDELRRVVVGQDDAIREISVALVKHLLGHSSGNILLIGNSGSGKTTLMKAVEQFLTQREDLRHYSNVVRINANVLTEEREGYGRSVLSRLYRNAIQTLGPDAPRDEIVRRVECGIVFVDEVDKIRASVGGIPSVRGIIAQEAMLTLMENEHIELETGDAHGTISINSAAMLFVAGGAFEEMYENVLRRATLGKDVVPLKPRVVVSATGEVREELSFHLRDYLRYEDLFLYGMTPQFVSRFESIVALNDLSEGDLARIFVEPDASIFRTSREYFKRFNIDLQITKGAIRAIAWDASRQKRLGARALKEVYRRVIRGLEFDPRGKGSPGAEGRQIVTVDEDMVRQAIRIREQGSAQGS